MPFFPVICEIRQWAIKWGFAVSQITRLFGVKTDADNLPFGMMQFADKFTLFLIYSTRNRI
ncbi:MAG: hypothetical protein LBM56_01115, partial [Burkholderiaceae bacterium]|nr:hypothetical protein [Burkholderiaceae bacterium]